MANLFEETVVDFDLNFLQPSKHDVNNLKLEKQRQSIANIKNKIIKSHCLLQKYYLQRDRLEEAESLLLASKEECKQACLDYKVTLEKCLQLEKDAQKLKDINRELEQKINHLDNQCEAMKSHAHQLQLLVKEHETVIQALNLEKQLEKNTIKESEKKLNMYEKERDTYLQDIKWMRDVILGKRKAKSCKNILNKYKKLKSSEDKSESENSDDDSYFGNSPPGSPLNEVLNKQEICFTDKIVKDDNENSILRSGSNSLIKSQENNDNDSDCCHEEVVSEDTGRGSSLAFSDAEKFMNSPEIGYCITDNQPKIINKEIIIHVDVATSPMRTEDNFTNEINTKTPNYCITDFPLSTEIVTIEEKKQLVDCCSSPIPQIHHMKDISTSPVVFENPAEIHSEVIDCLNRNACSEKDYLNCQGNQPSSSACHMNINTLSNGSEIEISTESTDSSELNCPVETDNNIANDRNVDLEVERIFSHMRLRHKLISPIPKTPKKLHKHKIPLQDNISNHIVCPDALKIKEENKALHANISFLCKEIMLIKKMLNTKSPNLESMLTSNSEKIIDENSRETIILPNNELNMCGSERTYMYNSSDNLAISALSKLVDDGPIHIENIDEQQTETVNLDFNVGSLDRIEINDTSLKHTKEKEPNKQDIKNNPQDNKRNDLLYLKSQCRTENAVQYKETSQPSIERNDSQNENMKITSCDNNKDNSNYTSFTEESSQLTKSDDLNYVNIAFDMDEDVSSDNVDNINHLDDHSDRQISNKNTESNSNTKTKSKKLTKLDKFKNKMLPKSKISRLNAPLRKLKKRNRLVPVSKLDPRSKPLQILNNKDAYDKALKVMSEIKFKSRDEKMKSFCKPNAKLSKIPSCKSMRENRSDSFDVLSALKTSEKTMATDNENGHEENNHPLKEKEAAPNNVIAFNCSEIITRSKCNPKQSHEENHNKIACNTPIESKSPKNNRRRKRLDSDESNVSCKRMLRSSTIDKLKNGNPDLIVHDQNVTDYSDLDIFSTNMDLSIEKENMLSERNIEKSCKQPGCNEQTCSDTINICSINEQNSVRRSKRLCSNISNANSNKLPPSPEKDKKECNIEIEEGTNFGNGVSHPNSSLDGKIKKSSNETISESSNSSNKQKEIANSEYANNLGNSILCKMILKHGRNVVRHSSSKVAGNTINSICKTVENAIANIIELSTGPSGNQIQAAIDELVENMKTYNKKSLLAGLMKYLEDPARKLELYNKVNCHPSMAMTKKEQIILSVLQKLNTSENKLVDDLLRNIEYTLFRLNKTPEFDTIEGLSHFYAVTCRLFHMKYRLKTFLLDAMYCLQFKSVIIIKQCLTTWMHILPLAHSRYAKTPLITCIVYLLHFYKCEDKFYNIQNIRWILNKKYSYTFSEWNETKILEMFVNAIKFVKDDPVESNMLRLALLIFGKRHGPKWCQRHVINNMLLPMIEDEKTPEKVKIFCIKVLGPLLKPYPGDMKVHCEIIVNQLLDMLDQKDLTHGITEAVITSLIYMSKHNPPRVTKALLSWQPETVSKELENLLKAYVREKPIKAWKSILSNTYV